MKRWSLFLLPMGLLCVPALAAEGELVTWAALGTYAGAVMAVTFAERFFSRLPWLSTLDPLVRAYLTALLLLLGTAAFTGGLTLSGGLLCTVNAVIVALAATGMDTCIRTAAKGKPQKEKPDE